MEFLLFALFIIIVLIAVAKNTSTPLTSTPPVHTPKHDDLDDHSLFSRNYTSDDTFYRSTWDDDYILRSSTWDDDFSTRHDDIFTDPAYCHIPGNIYYHSCHDDTSTSISSSSDDWSLSSSSWDDWTSSSSSWLVFLLKLQLG